MLFLYHILDIVGMGHPKNLHKIDIAMAHSLYLVSVYEGGTLIGLGRIVGDGGITFAITDIMVDKRYQRQGIADRIADMIDQWIEQNADENSFIMLLANKPADLLYKKYRFDYLEENMVGMLRK